MKTKTESNRNVEWGKNPKHRRADGEQNWKHKSGRVEQKGGRAGGTKGKKESQFRRGQAEQKNTTKIQLFNIRYIQIIRVLISFIIQTPDLKWSAIDYAKQVIVIKYLVLNLIYGTFLTKKMSSAFKNFMSSHYLKRLLLMDDTLKFQHFQKQRH